MIVFLNCNSVQKHIEYQDYHFDDLMMFWSNDRDNDGNLGMHQQASGQQHSLLSQSAHFVNGPFPATLQVSAKYDIKLIRLHSTESYELYFQIKYFDCRNQYHQYLTMGLYNLKYLYSYIAWLHFFCNICIYTNLFGGYPILTMHTQWYVGKDHFIRILFTLYLISNVISDFYPQ